MTRLFLLVLAAVAGIPAVLHAEARPPGVNLSNPNVVLIICDDLNDYIEGLGGHPQARTPHIAKLAASGVSFTRAYSNNPVCAPSRASFLTRIYPHTSGNLFWKK